MKKAPYLLLFVTMIIVASYFAGVWQGRRDSRDGESRAGLQAGPRILHYVDPMNPAHTSDKPGPAPCGMPMEPVYAEEGEDASSRRSTAPKHPGAVRISPQKQQVVGIRIDRVKKAPWTATIKSPGLVVLDEARVYRINSSTSGWVREIFAGSTGSMVAKGEPLFAYYTPTFLNAQQSYFYVLNTLDSMRKNEFDEIERQSFTNVQLRTATDNLRNLGVSENRLRELAQNREFVRNITVEAPSAGFVLARNLTLEQKFEAGTELYQIADLSRVWILADIRGQEHRQVKTGQTVRLFVPDSELQFEAAVSKILPQYDAASRTMKVRIEAENPEFILRPNMYVEAEFSVELPSAISVPLDAVFDTGARKTVFIDRENGYFEPREVKTGWRFGGRVEIVEGLLEGERFVVSGNFLIDSESKMRLAAAGFYGAIAKDPVCQMYVNSEKAATAGLKIEYGGTAFYFCSEGCLAEFDKQPRRFLEKQTGKEAPEESSRAVEGIGKNGTTAREGHWP